MLYPSLYQYYGKLIQSNFSLPEYINKVDSDRIKSVNDGIAFYLAEKGSDQAFSRIFAGKKQYLFVQRNRAVMYHEQIGAFFSEKGRRLFIYPASGVEENFIKLVVLGTMMPLLLYQQGMFLIHASAIFLNGKAVLCLGTSGMGKSSLAAAMHECGHAVIADDIVPISLDNGAIMAMPGYPLVKMDLFTADVLRKNANDLSIVTTSIENLGIMTQGNFVNSPCPLGHVLILKYGNSQMIERIKPKDALFELIRNTLPTMWGVSADRAHFQNCARLSHDVPFSYFIRENNRESLLEHARFLEANLQIPE